MTDTNQRIILTKRMLKEGLLRLLETKQLDKINVTELCRESGINRATFYRHYEVPRDILNEMQMDFFEDVMKSFHYPLSKNDIVSFFTNLYDHSEQVKLFIKYNTEMDWSRIFNHLYDRLPGHDSLKDYQNRDQDSTKLLMTYISGGAYFMMRQWLMEDIPKTPAEVADIALSLFDEKKLFAPI